MTTIIQNWGWTSLDKAEQASQTVVFRMQICSGNFLIVPRQVDLEVFDPYHIVPQDDQARGGAGWRDIGARGCLEPSQV